MSGPALYMDRSFNCDPLKKKMPSGCRQMVPHKIRKRTPFQPRLQPLDCVSGFRYMQKVRRNIWLDVSHVRPEALLNFFWSLCDEAWICQQELAKFLSRAFKADPT